MASERSADCVIRAVDEASSFIANDGVVAVATIWDCVDLMLEHRYWGSEQVPPLGALFERRVAVAIKQLNAPAAAIAVPMIFQESEDGLELRSPVPPIWDGEREGIWAVGFDVEDGLIICRLGISRTPTGDPIFDPAIEELHGINALKENAPGKTMMEWVMQ